MMRWLWYLLSFYFPLCATIGIAGIAAPGVMDFARFKRAPYSTALIAPAGFAAAPDIVSPVYDVSAPVLFAVEMQVTSALPRSFPLDDPASNQASFVVRSRAANFPDVVEFAAVPEGPGKSSLVFYSHSLYGWYAYGVNIKRATAWLQAIDMKVKQ